MGRIDEAIRRARQRTPDEAGSTEEPGPAASGAGTADAAVPSADLFRTPWHFEPVPLPSDADPETGPPPASSPPFPAAAQARPAGASPGMLEPADPRLDTPQAPPPGSGTGEMAVFRAFDERVAERLVVSPHITSEVVEQYRKLAGTLHHAQLERNIRTVMISSAVPGEGKTLTATNLALTLSESFRRTVLLVDADLRRPSLHQVFQVPNLSGLNDGLKSEVERRLSIVRVSETLSLLTAGRPDADPMSGLSSPRIRRIVEEAAARFDWVLIDTPPVALLPDARLLATTVDVALLVIQAESTPYDLVQKAIEQLGRERILGVVLNRAEEGLQFGHYHKYYGYDRPSGRREH